jgi:hypothetical protein
LEIIVTQLHPSSLTRLWSAAGSIASCLFALPHRERLSLATFSIDQGELGVTVTDPRQRPWRTYIKATDSDGHQVQISQEE